MTTLQAIILGMLLALTPSTLFLTWVLWQDGKLPPHDQLELPYRCFENTASDLINCAEHINDNLTNQHELVARLRLINSCRLVLVSVGFDVSMRRKPVVIEDEGQDYAPLRWRRNDRDEVPE
jgi:hypothetical protein